MAVGYAVSVGSVNNKAGNLATQWQLLCYNTLQFYNYIQSQGPTGLVTIGFSSGDATAMGNLISQLGQLAGTYFGTDSPQTVGFNYDAAFSVLRGTGPG